MRQVLLRFEDGSEPFHELRIHRLEYTDGLNQPFSLLLGVLSADHAVEPKLVLGKQVEVVLEGEPWLSHLRGIVVGFRQRTTMGTADGASLYELSVRPPLWLLAKRLARRIHQDATCLEAIATTLASLEGSAPPPVDRVGRTLERPEYTVQYDETDLAFTRRLLAENHLVSYFDWTAAGAWTVTDDLGASAPVVPTPLVYRPPTGDLTPTQPHALSFQTSDELGVTRVSLRDYDFEHPQLVRSSPAGLDGQAVRPPLPNERGEREDMQIARFASDQEGAVIAQRELAAMRSKDHVVTCATNLAMGAGTSFVLVDHPRADLGREFLVIGSTILLDDGLEIAGEPVRGAGRRYQVTCVPKSLRHYAEPIVRPRVPATEVGFVVGDGADGTVDVDAYGRVKVELLWDRRDLRRGNPTLRVRVSQAWAGANHGIVTLPRIGDEVLVSYLGGDPDQPIVVGRVHNALSRTPLSLPDPDDTLSVWRSRTIGGDGYNEILMDDAPGGERLWLRAEREHRLHVKGHSTVQIDGDSKVNVGGNCDVEVAKHLSVKSASFSQSTGPYEVRTSKTLHSARDEMRLESDTIIIEGKSKVQIVCGGSDITLTPGGITISSGSVTVQAGDVKIAAESTVDIDGGAIVDIDGGLITLN
jgi:type VI secretion system secreted protein VgrG